MVFHSFSNNGYYHYLILLQLMSKHQKDRICATIFDSCPAPIDPILLARGVVGMITGRLFHKVSIRVHSILIYFLLLNLISFLCEANI